MSKIIEIDLSSDSEPDTNAPNVDLQTTSAAPASSVPSASPINNAPTLSNVLALSNLNIISPKPEAPEKKKKRKNFELKKLGKVFGQFDPEKSNREKRKLMQKIQIDDSIKTGHDSDGLLYGPEKIDLCDCLDKDCAGCFLPCRCCRSPKCGFECRVNRRWILESIEREAEHTIVRNKWANLAQNN